MKKLHKPHKGKSFGEWYLHGLDRIYLGNLQSSPNRTFGMQFKEYAF